MYYRCDINGPSLTIGKVYEVKNHDGMIRVKDNDSWNIYGHGLLEYMKRISYFMPNSYYKLNNLFKN